MRLYSGPLSLFTAKVRIALAEKGLAYERVEVGWSLADRYRPHHPDVLALNPKAEVPVLVDGDVVVYDSTLVNEYLEERHPVPALFPSDVGQRARCRQLEAAADEILFPHVWTLIDKGFYPGPRDGVALAGPRDGVALAGPRDGVALAGPRDEAALEAARDAVARYCEDREKELAHERWLCGDFSVADIAHFVFLNAAVTLGAPLRPEHTALARWFERAAAQPAVAQEVTEMRAFVAKLFAPPDQGSR